MKVKIKLFATLRNYGPDEQETELPENATLEDALTLLNLPEKIPVLKIVNGEHRNLKHLLKEGDEIALFPPIAGGQHTCAQGFPFSITTERNIQSCRDSKSLYSDAGLLRGLPLRRICLHPCQKSPD